MASQGNFKKRTLFQNVLKYNYDLGKLCHWSACIQTDRGKSEVLIYIPKYTIK